MTLNWHKTNDGYMVTSEGGRAVCRIQTKRLTHVEEIQKPDNRRVWIEQEEAIPRENWLFHFAGRYLTLAEITALHAEMPTE